MLVVLTPPQRSETASALIRPGRGVSDRPRPGHDGRSAAAHGLVIPRGGAHRSELSRERGGGDSGEVLGRPWTAALGPNCLCGVASRFSVRMRAFRSRYRQVSNEWAECFDVSSLLTAHATTSASVIAHVLEGRFTCSTAEATRGHKQGPLKQEQDVGTHFADSN